MKMIETKKYASKGPKMETLKKNRRSLTEEERKEVMSRGAVWHNGPNGEETPGVWKAVVDGKEWYVCNTHRAYQCKPTLKGAIKAFDFIETTSSSEVRIKYAQLKDANTLKSIIQSYIGFAQQFPVYEEDYENHVLIAYFEQMIEGIDIEVVFYDKLVEKNFGSIDRDIIRHLQNLEPIPNGTNEEKANFIKNVYETLFDRNHVVRGNLFFMDAIAEVREWLDKNSKFRESY